MAALNRPDSTFHSIQSEPAPDYIKAPALSASLGTSVLIHPHIPQRFENPGEWYYFDLVPEEYEIRIGAPDYTGKVCVIGSNLNEAELKKAFGD